MHWFYGFITVAWITVHLTWFLCLESWPDLTVNSTEASPPTDTRGTKVAASLDFSFGHTLESFLFHFSNSVTLSLFWFESISPKIWSSTMLSHLQLAKVSSLARARPTTYNDDHYLVILTNTIWRYALRSRGKGSKSYNCAMWVNCIKINSDPVQSISLLWCLVNVGS